MKKGVVSDRRRFLGGLLAGLGAVGGIGARKARATPENANEKETLYRRTEHVEAYYRTLKD